MVRGAPVTAGALALTLLSISVVSAQMPSVSIPACDDYLNKLEACVASTAPGSRKNMLKEELELARKTFVRDANTLPKASYELLCKTYADGKKRILVHFDCTF